MKVCVVGAGAIGSLYAAHLARVTDVSVLTRREDHARALNEQGLRVSGRHDFTARVTAAAAASDLPHFDLGIIATKATGLEAVPFPYKMTTICFVGPSAVVPMHSALTRFRVA